LCRFTDVSSIQVVSAGINMSYPTPNAPQDATEDPVVEPSDEEVYDSQMTTDSHEETFGVPANQEASVLEASLFRASATTSLPPLIPMPVLECPTSGISLLIPTSYIDPG
jgi:hypothetical protein